MPFVTSSFLLLVWPGATIVAFCSGEGLVEEFSLEKNMVFVFENICFSWF